MEEILNENFIFCAVLLPKVYINPNYFLQEPLLELKSM